jgi:hypothetical protein
MAAPELKRKLWSATAFIVPLLAVKAASVVLVDSGPQTAEATVSNPVTVASAARRNTKLTDQQVAVQRHVQVLSGKPIESDPMLYQGLEPEKPVEPEIKVPVIVETPKIEPPPTFELQLVMSGVRGDTALIDGRPYRVGDRIRDTDWKVQSIEVGYRSASLLNVNDGRTLIISVDLPLQHEGADRS